ncbi:hypothetical protein XF35_41065, partial [Streptomyces platensis subsp. clarensis]|nr:hypothetical protein [Streptomyces platensis subsp. clarensis]
VVVIGTASASTVIATQVWMSGASVMATVSVVALAVANVAWAVNATRRSDSPSSTVTCGQDGCGVQIEMAGVSADEQARLTAIATDHARHGAA